MKYPNFSEEKKLWRKGYKWVMGLDEAGRGPLAGPVVAAAACFNKNPKSNIYNLISNLKDSKKLSPKKREEFYKILTNHPQIEWGIGKVSERVIDKINILEATKLAMKKAIRNLEKKYSYGRIRISRGKKPSERFSYANFLILDGNFKLNFYSHAQKSIIKADEKVMSCAAASVISKVTRDRIMKREHKKYPQYGFDRNKGYGTKEHLKNLKKYKSCSIHRKSFKPLKKFS